MGDSFQKPDPPRAKRGATYPEVGRGVLCPKLDHLDPLRSISTRSIADVIYSALAIYAIPRRKRYLGSTSQLVTATNYQDSTHK